MAIRVERPTVHMGAVRDRVFPDADGWDVSKTGNLELSRGDKVVVEIVAGDWTLVEDLPED